MNYNYMLILFLFYTLYMCKSIYIFVSFFLCACVNITYTYILIQKPIRDFY